MQAAMGFAEIGVTMTIQPTEFPAKWVVDVMKATDYVDMTINVTPKPKEYIDIYSRDPYYFTGNPAVE